AARRGCSSAIPSSTSSGRARSRPGPRSRSSSPRSSRCSWSSSGATSRSRTWSPVAERIDTLETMPVSPYARLTRRLLWILAVLVMGFLYLPIVLLVLFSFNEPRTPGLPITGLTLDWYREALKDRVLLDAVRNSVVVAVLVAVLATTIGTMAAFVLVRGRIRFPGAARVVATMPIMLPGMLLGIGILIFL